MLHRLWSIVALTAMHIAFDAQAFSQQSSHGISAKEEESFRSSILESIVEAPLRVQRFDFKWAEYYHQAVTAIQKKDAEAFGTALHALDVNDKTLTSKQKRELQILLSFLRRSFVSVNEGLLDLDRSWIALPHRDWDSDVLLAMHDVVADLDSPSQSLKKNLLQKIRRGIDEKHKGLESAFDKSHITRKEFVRFSFSHLRRLEEDESTVAECARLLSKVKQEFSLQAILVERLSRLHKKAPGLWSQKYHQSLKEMLVLLEADRNLREHFPLAMPKVVHELAVLEPSDTLRICILRSVVDACVEANAFIDTTQETASIERAMNRTSLKELRASALVRGYQLLATLDNKTDSSPSWSGQVIVFPANGYFISARLSGCL